MKKFLYFLSFMFLVACESEEDGQGKPYISKDFVRALTNLELVADGQEAELSIESNCSWDIIVSDEWITASPTSGHGTMKVNLSAKKNSTGLVRSTTLKIVAGTAPEFGISVTQPAILSDEKMLRINPEELSFEAESSSKEFSIYSNTKWTIACPDWCSLSTSSGTNDGKVVITVSSNPYNDERKGTITVYGEGVPEANLQLTQKAKEEDPQIVPNADDNHPPQ